MAQEELRDTAKAGFSEQLASKEARIQEIERELANKCSLIAELEDTVLSQNTLLEASESKIGMKTYEISSLIKELKDSGELINALNEKVALAREDNMALSDKVSEAESQRDSLAKLVQDMEMKSSEREALILEIESEFTNSCSFIATLEQKVSDQNSFLDKQTNEIVKLTAEVKDTEKVLNLLRDDFAMVNEEKKSFQTQAREAAAQHALLISTLEEKLLNQDSMLKAVQSELLKKTGEISRLTQDLNDRNEIIHAMNANKALSDEELEILRMHVGEVENQRGILSKSLLEQENKVNDLEAINRNVTGELAEKVTTCASLKAKLASQSSLLESSESEIRKKSEEVTVLFKEMDACKDLIKVLNANLALLKEEHNDLRQFASGMESERDSLAMSNSDLEITKNGLLAQVRDMENELAEKSASLVASEKALSINQSLLEASQNENLQKSDEISKLKTKVTECGVIIDDLNAVVASSKVEHESLSIKFDKMASQCDSLSVSLLEKQVKMNELEASIQETEKELTEKCLSMSTLEETLLNKTSLLEASQADILLKTDEISSLSKSVKDCEELISELNADLSLLREEHGSLRSLASDNETQRDSLSKLISDLEVKNSCSEAQIQDIRNNLADKCALITVLEEKISRQNTLLEASASEILTKSNEISRRAMEAKKYDEVIEAMKADAAIALTKFEDLFQRSNNLEEERDSLSNLLADQTTKSSTLDASIKEIRLESSEKSSYIVSLEETLSSQNSHLDALQNEILKKEDEILGLKKEVNNREELIHALKGTTASLQEEHSSLSNKAILMENERDSLSRAISELEIQRNSMEAQIQEIEKKAAEKSLSVAALEDELLTYKSLLEASNNEILVKTEEISKIMNDLKDCGEQIDALNAEVSLLRIENGSLRSLASDLEAQRDSLSKLICELEIQNNQRETQIICIKEELSDKCSSISALEEDMSNQKSVIEKFESENYQKTNEILKLKKEVSDHNELITSLKNDVAAANDTVVTLTNKADDIERERDCLSELVSILEMKNCSLCANREEISRELAAKNGVITTLEGEILNQQLLLEASEKDVLSMTGNISRLTNEINDYSELASALMANVVSLKEELLGTLRNQATANESQKNSLSMFISDLQKKSNEIEAHILEIETRNKNEPPLLDREVIVADAKGDTITATDALPSLRSSPTIALSDQPLKSYNSPKSRDTSIARVASPSLPSFHQEALECVAQSNLIFLLVNLRFSVLEQLYTKFDSIYMESEFVGGHSTFNFSSNESRETLFSNGIFSAQVIAVLLIELQKDFPPLKDNAKSSNCSLLASLFNPVGRERTGNIILQKSLKVFMTQIGKDLNKILFEGSHSEVSSETLITRMRSFVTGENKQHNIIKSSPHRLCHEEHFIQDDDIGTDPGLNVLSISSSSETPIQSNIKAQCLAIDEGEEATEVEKAMPLVMTSPSSSSSIPTEPKTIASKLLSSIQKSKLNLTSARKDKSRSDDDVVQEGENEETKEGEIETMCETNVPVKAKARKVLTSFRNSLPNLTVTRKDKSYNDQLMLLFSPSSSSDVPVSLVSNDSEMPTTDQSSNIPPEPGRTKVRHFFNSIRQTLSCDEEDETKKEDHSNTDLIMPILSPRSRAKSKRTAENSPISKEDITKGDGKDGKSTSKYKEAIEKVVNDFLAVGVHSEIIKSSLCIDRAPTEAELLDFMEKVVESRQHDSLNFMADFFREGTISRAAIQSTSKAVCLCDWFPRKWYPRKDLTYAIFIDEEKKRVTVVFRGSITESDWGQAIEHTTFHKMPNPVKDSFEGKKEFIKLHRGFFLYLFEEVTDMCKYDEIAGVVDRYGREKIGENYSVFVSGFGLGGALATIFSFFASTEERFTKNGPLKCITFGAPMVGSHAFADSFLHQERQQKLMLARFHNPRDLVTHLPLNMKYATSRGASFCHVGIPEKHLTDAEKDLPFEQLYSLKYATSRGASFHLGIREKHFAKAEKDLPFEQLFSLKTKERQNETEKPKSVLLMRERFQSYM